LPMSSFICSAVSRINPAVVQGCFICHRMKHP
jgi:hypothetical protein